jgi:hypothetical protein
MLMLFWRQTSTAAIPSVVLANPFLGGAAISCEAQRGLFALFCSQIALISATRIWRHYLEEVPISAEVSEVHHEERRNTVK